MMEPQEIIKRFAGGYVCGDVSTKELGTYLQELIALRAENETLNNRLAVAVSLKADNKDEFDWNVLDEIHRLRSLLKECGEDAERLFAGLLPVYSQKGKPGFRGVAPKFCDFCGARPTVEHNPECVITLHHALMEKLKGEG